ncbi:MAG: TonB-dependent receptor [Flavobacteriales bacterium]|nr:TonB-dependent receptor [Flavobacteriales bacterium]
MTSSYRYPILSLALLPLCLVAQDPIMGVVLGTEADDPRSLPGASVLWVGTTIGTATDAQGRFEVPPPDSWPARLVASFVGYAPDTVLLAAHPGRPVSFTLRPGADLRAVEIIERQSSTLLDTRSQLATEIITAMELKRAACCDLSESFETNASVDVSYNDAISGTKTIRLLGLDGKYAQISLENIPFIRGLSTASGLTLIPGTWINEINLSKGVGTAVNAPNAMTGQIDVCLLQPADESPFYLNMYGNTQGRLEANIHSAQSTGQHSDNLLLVHGNWFDNEMDQNGDGFMDMPITRRINVMDRWVYRDDKRTAQLAARYVDDRRTGGQSAEHGAMPVPPEHVGHRPDMLYGIDIRNEMVDVLGKYGFVFGEARDKSIGLIAAGKHHDVRSLYGERGYDGTQTSFYGNLVYQQQLGGCEDAVKTGLAFQYDDYREAFRDSAFTRTERMPGIFAEYTRKREKLTSVLGLRADANDHFGNTVSPRLHIKYDLGPLTVARVSAGHAFRSANPLAESATVLASSRNVVVEGPLGLERAWNFGASLLHKFKLLDRKWEVGVDAYHTRFTQQVVMDLDRSPQTIAFYMLDGLSYGTSMLADVQVQLAAPLTLRLNYRWYDARTTYDGRLLERPFTPMHRGMIDLAYADRKEQWRFDIGLQLFGESRIPDTSTNPEAYRFGERAPSFATMHAQLTRVMGQWDLYLGAENITNTLQRRQIIAPEDPFGPYFDASLIWGPTNLAMVYGGLRYTLPRKKENPTDRP